MIEDGDLLKINIQLHDTSHVRNYDKYFCLPFRDFRDNKKL